MDKQEVKRILRHDGLANTGFPSSFFSFLFSPIQAHPQVTHAGLQQELRLLWPVTWDLPALM